MSEMAPVIGDISTSPNDQGIVVEWRINGIVSLTEKVGVQYRSPDFSFAGQKMCLELSSEGWRWTDSSGHFDMYLCRKSTRQELSLSLEAANGEKDHEAYSTITFEENVERVYIRFLLRSEFMSSGVLTVVCSIMNPTSTGGAADQEHQENFEDTCVDASTQTKEENGGLATAECPHCKITLEAASMADHEKFCTDRPTKCPECLEIVASRLWLDHKCLTARTNAIEKLLHDLKRIMERGDHSDMTVSVRGEEFRLHRSLLGARNRFFDRKFNHENPEKATDNLSFDNCDPDQFRTLIHYIYTGMVNNLCPENVCNLYEVAVAFQEDQLKADCLQFMMNTLSVDNFCDYTAFLLKHGEKELFQKATELFMPKIKEIIRHSKWKTFLEKYPAQANELYLKALDLYDEK